MSVTNDAAGLGVGLLAVALAACGPLEPASSPVLQMGSDQSSIDGRSQRAIIRFRAFDAKGANGSGRVALTAPIGAFVEGDSVELSDGLATAAYRCDPTELPACAGDVRLSASWNGVQRSILVKVGPLPGAQVQRFRVEPTFTLSALNALAVSTDGTAWAVGEEGAVVRYGSAGWQVVPSGTSQALVALTPLPGAKLAAVGARTTLVLLDPSRPPVVVQGDAQDDFTGVYAVSATQLVAVTSTGRTATWDGTGFSYHQLTEEPLGGISGRGAELWAFGRTGLFHADVTGWHPESAPLFASWRRITVTQDGVWLVGQREDTSGEYIVVRGPTPDWRSVGATRLVMNDFTFTPDSTEQLAVANTDVLRRDGTEAWQPLSAPSGGKAIAARFKGDLIVVGPRGFSVHKAQ